MWMILAIQFLRRRAPIVGARRHEFLSRDDSTFSDGVSWVSGERRPAAFAVARIDSDVLCLADSFTSEPGDASLMDTARLQIRRGGKPLGLTGRRYS